MNGSELGAVVKPVPASEAQTAGTGGEPSGGRDLADALTYLYQGFPREGVFHFAGIHWFVTSMPERPVFGLPGARFMARSDDGQVVVFYRWRRGKL